MIDSSNFHCHSGKSDFFFRYNGAGFPVNMKLWLSLVVKDAERLRSSWNSFDRRVSLLLFFSHSSDKMTVTNGNNGTSLITSVMGPFEMLKPFLVSYLRTVKCVSGHCDCSWLVKECLPKYAAI